MTALDIAVTRELIQAAQGLIPPSRSGLCCWCPAPKATPKHTEACARMRAAIYEARKAGY